MRSQEALLTIALSVVVPLFVVAAVLASVAVVRRLHGPARRWGDVARSRLVMGVPWGSLLVIALVYCVYLFVQDGITAFGNPVTLPYRAYSYFYPLGMLTASFSHAGPGHLIGNLAGAAVVAPIAEYAWGHYPDERGETAFASWRTDPWIRALVIFPLIVVAITIGSSLFALGPVIGFSGVVFAFAAFALVHYPIVTLVGVLGVQGALLTLYRALQTPIGVYVSQSRPRRRPRGRASPSRATRWGSSSGSSSRSGSSGGGGAVPMRSGSGSRSCCSASPRACGRSTGSAARTSTTSSRAPAS